MTAADEQSALSLAFMRAHPVPAARVLEALPAAEAAGLFARAPARVGAGVLAAMLPLKAARCVDTLDDRRALELLAPMGAQPAIALLRHLPEPRRQALMAGLPTATALASTLLLAYAEDALGAWVDPDVVVLPPQARVEEALARLRAGPPTHATLCVADADRRLRGLVTVPALLQAPPGSALAGLMQAPAALLAAHAPLSAVLSHPGWQAASLLPVVEPGDRLVGVLTHDAVCRAVARLSPPPAPQAQGLSSALAQGYWQAVSGLLTASLAGLPRGAPVQAAEEPRR